MNQSLDEKKCARLDAVVDIVYLLGLAFIYVISLVLPILGIAIAIILKTGALTERVKKVGRVCLILGLAGLGLWLLAVILVFLAAAVLMSSYGWYW